MKNRFFFFLSGLIFLLLSNNFLFSQTSIKIKGKILSETKDLDGITISNLNTNENVTSNSEGFFEIFVSKSDSLSFSGIQFISKKIILNEKDIKNEILYVKLEVLVRNIDEVVVNQYPQINSVSLGIVSKNQKKYTKAERRLYTAGDFKPIQLLNILGGSLPIDPIINAINGKTKMLKKEVNIEKKEFYLEKINRLYDDDYLKNRLKIPVEYVSGFKYYLLEDANFLNAVENKNKTLATFLIGEVAVKYLEIINEK